MQFAVLSLFPEMFSSPFSQSIIGKAVEKGLIGIETHQLRDYAEGRHQVTDDTPYGGGDGMVMKPEPVWRGIQDMRQRYPQAKVVLMTPQGRMFNQAEARHLASHEALVFVCGRYEGFDERIRSYVDAEYSIGDYVLTGGELPAMVVIDAVARLVPGVLGNAGSAGQDSHSDGLLEFPHYTRPVEFNGQHVPEILLSGNHAHIDAWRNKQQRERTKARRPDLWQQYMQQQPPQDGIKD
ncbi:MAG: tRNA (guanosine(37)-N1)-methyltransferase TrmD [Desulfuromonadaceae bacterium]|nr:tRNA (guanosine(37)-N1)-methyltransferase TrmD [Desulfuromonas sp.]MDY0184500.1 tRNA (guanosine(37)-N1)-methyltransferase TrmD [Desulfuromonadaceae bacterium]